MDLLLISNSTEHGRGYLDHVEEEIRELLGAIRRAPVVGLREGAFLRARGGSVLLGGAAGARIFRRGAAPVEARSGDRIGPLLR
jgi:dipeptidase E